MDTIYIPTVFEVPPKLHICRSIFVFEDSRGCAAPVKVAEFCPDCKEFVITGYLSSRPVPRLAMSRN